MGAVDPLILSQQTVAAIDLPALIQRLEQDVDGEIRFDAGSRAIYGQDGSNYRQIPIGVVIPRNVAALERAVAVCRAFGAPILARGAGTSLCGQTVNVAVVIDTSKYLSGVGLVDPKRRTALVEPGVICDDLRRAAEAHTLTFGPDPATHNRCTLGGMIGNNSCGAHSVMAGKTVDNIERLEVLTYDGARFWVGATTEEELAEIIRAGGRKGEIYAELKALRDEYQDLIRAKFPKILRRVSGYNLDELLPENGFNVARALVGSEGTCVMVVQAETKLVYSPPARALAVLGYPDIFHAGDQTPAILQHGAICLEGLDRDMINDMRRKNVQVGDIAYLPEGGAWLLVEFGAETVEEAEAKARALVAAQAEMLVDHALYTDRAVQARVWGIREVGANARNAVPGQPETYPGWEDAAVDPNRIGDYLREYKALLDKYGYSCSLYGHFGDGCIHGRVDFDWSTPEKVAHWRKFMFEAAELVVAYGGSLSGEHGDGQARAELLPIMFGEELMEAFRRFKRIWDPLNRMNPGKLIDAYPLDANLRTGPTYKARTMPITFSFHKDEGSFTKAAHRCVGMGKCRRREGGGAMCPSYRATNEEKYSTRGRSRLLFEMITESEDSPVKDGWKSDAVKEALDLCLSCKSCKSECPVNVDMATYKAEFLSHYYEGRRRPRKAYTVGLIHRWARLASRMPRLVNFVTGAPILGSLAKWVAGVAQDREVPRFATQTFVSRFKRRPRQQAARKVMLWPDTFNNHFTPETAMNAVTVLEHAGFEVVIPQVHLCCGRPLYDFGMLDQARAQLLQILDVIGDEVNGDFPLVGLEPSCVAVFRDEMLNLFPEDPRAQRLSANTLMLSELLDKVGYEPPLMKGEAVVHAHCHHKAVMGVAAENRILGKTGLKLKLLDSGCCGMAGSFGFDPDHVEVSRTIGEQVLLPAVRAADKDTLIVTNGFSCREQIHQETPRQTRHLADVLAEGIGQAGQRQPAQDSR